MKTQINMTTSWCDLDRYSSREHFLSVLDGFDGVELMLCGEDNRGIIPADKVIGLHMSSFYCWLDFWRGDMARCLVEFGSAETAFAYYGGSSPEVLTAKVRSDYENAKRLGAEYMVFHVSDSNSLETLSGKYAHTDEEVVDAAAEILNAALPHDSDGPMLLLENLWEPGLRFTRPDITARLLDSVKYPNCGIMLDTGHLMHTDLSLHTQKDALAYIHRCLDLHGELCSRIKGIHLNQSLTGSYMKSIQKNPPELSRDYSLRSSQLFSYIFKADLHRPFVCPGVRELIERIAPDYLTYEFISRDLNEHIRLLRRQKLALK